MCHVSLVQIFDKLGHKAASKKKPSSTEDNHKPYFNVLTSILNSFISLSCPKNDAFWCESNVNLFGVSMRQTTRSMCHGQWKCDSLIVIQRFNTLQAASSSQTFHCSALCPTTYYFWFSLQRQQLWFAWMKSTMWTWCRFVNFHFNSPLFMFAVDGKAKLFLYLCFSLWWKFTRKKSLLNPFIQTFDQLLELLVWHIILWHFQEFFGSFAVVQPNKVLFICLRTLVSQRLSFAQILLTFKSQGDAIHKSITILSLSPHLSPSIFAFGERISDGSNSTVK